MRIHWNPSRSSNSDRLKLTTLRALAPAEEPADVARLALTKSSEPSMVPNWGNAAGSVVTSAEGMAKFWHALLTSKLLSKENTNRLFERLYPMFDSGTYYGRGVMLYSFMDNGAVKRGSDIAEGRPPSRPSWRSPRTHRPLSQSR